MKSFVAYYRVSTDQQGASGLGLEAQRAAVGLFIGAGRLIAQFTEIESGKAHTNRPQLLAALEQCRKYRATLAIAKLDRLGRNVAFISSLMESGVEFVCCDMPTANRLTIHILAAVAEHEREMISSRTKESLRAAKARGVQLGNPRIEEARKRAQAVHHARRPGPEILALMTDWQRQGESLRAIARRLNALHIRSSRGQWHGSSVRNAMAAV